MLVSEAVGKALAEGGIRVVFGLLGSGNLTVSNALRDAGAAFHAARHETGAVCMADGYARVSGEVACASVHQGPGLTNAITGLTEAAKSRTRVERRAVVLMLPLDVQAMATSAVASPASLPELAAPRPSDSVVSEVAE